ncbi:MAG: hypothetical protein AB7E81_02380 [Hyphomicrobiaceae bacterium]
MERWASGPLSPALLLISAITVVAPAEAHEIIPGVTGFPSLLLHPFVAVETALLMAGLAVVAGVAGRVPPMISGGAAIVIGAMVGVALQSSAVLLPGLWRVPLGLAFILGALAATGWRLPAAGVVGLGLLVAIAIGIAIPPERAGLIGRLEVAAAVVSAILLVILLIAVPRIAFDRLRPVRVAGQILGAWILAIALMGLAISLR